LTCPPEISYDLSGHTYGYCLKTTERIQSETTF
jgi:hypothetical protein